MIKKRVNLNSLFFVLGLLFVLTLIFSTPTFANTNIKRLSGNNRYETSVAISENGWNKSNYVVLATGENYPDALTSATLCKKYNAPILLTQGKVLTPITKNEITRLDAKNVIILGGTGVVSSNVENSLKAMNINTTRFAGTDRYDTSVKIADEITGEKELIVTTGDNFADALSISSVAGVRNIPIILVSKDNVSDSVKKFVSNHPVDKTYITGDSNIISDNVANTFSNVERITGNTQYERNQNIINKFKDALNFDTVYFATGENFADTLSGIGLAVKNNSPIILVNDKNSGAITTLLKDRTINNNVVLGGESAVTTASVNQVLGNNKNTEKTNDSGKFLPYLPDVPVVPNVDYYDVKTDKVTSSITYFYSGSKLSSNFFNDYGNLLVNNGWKLIDEKNYDEMGRPYYRYTKGGDIVLLEYTNDENGTNNIAIAGRMH